MTKKIMCIAKLKKAVEAKIKECEEATLYNPYKPTFGDLIFVLRKHLKDINEFEETVKERYVKLKSLMLIGDKKNYEFHKAEVRELRRILNGDGQR